MTHSLKTVLFASSVLLVAGAAFAETPPEKAGTPALAKTAANPEQKSPPAEKPPESGYFQPEEVRTTGAVTVGGQRIDYDAIAGTLVIHPKGWEDVPSKPQGDDKGDDKADDDHRNPTAEANMSFYAYFRHGARAETRPITFFWNGGPGSSTVWLHMGSLGPRRVVTADDTHTPAAPYTVVDNQYSLMDVSDVVFIDAPGTGFGNVAGRDREKAFWGVDADAHAFSDFIEQFLSKYGRWNSPKYIFGESYGTPRNAVVVNELENDRSIDLNGVIMLSQILNFALSADGADSNPGIDTPYVVALPTYAASAWYHHALPNQGNDLGALLREVEQFATTDYVQALQAGAALPADRRRQIIAKLHQYTGLPEAYIDRANLRVTGGEFEKNLLGAKDDTTGRFDTRFSGPSLDPLSKEAEYDPQSAAISSAYVTAFNDYVRQVLHFGYGKRFKPIIEIEHGWNFQHKPPGGDEPFPGTTNVMPDLAAAMVQNPNLHVLLNGGVYDLATPFFEGVYEMQHLPMPAALQKNVEYKQYQSGHMVYAHEASLRELHDTVADFIRRTDNLRR